MEDQQRAGVAYVADLVGEEPAAVAAAIGRLPGWQHGRRSRWAADPVAHWVHEGDEPPVDVWWEQTVAQLRELGCPERLIQERCGRARVSADGTWYWVDSQGVRVAPELRR